MKPELTHERVVATINRIAKRKRHSRPTQTEEIILAFKKFRIGDTLPFTAAYVAYKCFAMARPCCVPVDLLLTHVRGKEPTNVAAWILFHPGAKAYHELLRHRFRPIAAYAARQITAALRTAEKSSRIPCIPSTTTPDAHQRVAEFLALLVQDDLETKLQRRSHVKPAKGPTR